MPLAAERQRSRIIKQKINFTQRMLLFEGKKNPNARETLNARKSPKKWFAFFAVLLLIGLAAAGIPWAIKTKEARQIPEGSLTVTFLDVGQGNAILAECNGSYMLIDGGGRDTSSFLVSYLKQQGVEKLDYLISTHYDADHLWGLCGAMKVFEVGEIFCGDYVKDSTGYEKFMEYAQAENCPIIHPSVGETYQLGNATFTIVCPSSYDNEDVNENSIGIRLEFGENSFLMMGDADSANEEQMIDTFGKKLKSTVLLCSHHGSTYSTSEAFLAKVKPEYAVISCGKGNEYGHPHKRVLESLKENQIKLFRTDLQGIIIAESDGRSITWNMDPTEDYTDGWTLSGESENK